MSGCNPDEFVLHSVRIGGSTTLSRGRRRYTRTSGSARRGWRSETYKAYTCNAIEDSRMVSRKLVVASEGKGRRPGEEDGN